MRAFFMFLLFASKFMSVQSQRAVSRSGRGWASSALALAGGHPYNPLTGLMLRRWINLNFRFGFGDQFMVQARHQAWVESGAM